MSALQEERDTSPLPIVRFRRRTAFNASAATEVGADTFSLYTFVHSVPSEEEVQMHFDGFLNHLHFPVTAARMDQRSDIAGCRPARIPSRPSLSKEAAEMQVHAVSSSVFHSNDSGSSRFKLMDWRSVVLGDAASLGPQRSGDVSPPPVDPRTRRELAAAASFKSYLNPYEVYESSAHATRIAAGEVAASSSASASASPEPRRGTSLAVEEVEVVEQSEVEDVLLRVSSSESDESLSVLEGRLSQALAASSVPQDERAAEGDTAVEDDTPSNPIRFSGQGESSASTSDSPTPQQPKRLFSATVSPEGQRDMSTESGRYQLPPRVPGAVHPLLKVLRAQAVDCGPLKESNLPGRERQVAWEQRRTFVEGEIVKTHDAVANVKREVEAVLSDAEERGATMWTPNYRELKTMADYTAELEERCNKAATLYRVERHEEETIRTAHSALLLETASMRLLLKDVFQLAEASAALVRDATRSSEKAAVDIIQQDAALAQQLLECFPKNLN